MKGVDVREEMATLADQVWRGMEARDRLHELIRRRCPDDPGPTEITELTDYLYRPEYISRIAHGKVKEPKRPKRRRRVES